MTHPSSVSHVQQREMGRNKLISTILSEMKMNKTKQKNPSNNLKKVNINNIFRVLPFSLKGGYKDLYSYMKKLFLQG